MLKVVENFIFTQKASSFYQVIINQKFRKPCLVWSVYKDMHYIKNVRLAIHQKIINLLNVSRI